MKVIPSSSLLIGWWKKIGKKTIYIYCTILYVCIEVKKEKYEREKERKN